MSEAAPEEHWRRLHPLSPVLQSGRWAVFVVVVGLQQGFRDDSALVVAVVVVLGMVLAAVLSLVSWRVTRYRLTTTELQVDSGVLQRRQRRVPLARLQSVDVVRPLLARVLGLAELRMEVAGGGETEAPLRFLAEEDAVALRLQLLDRAAGRTAEAGDSAPPAAPVPEHVLVAVPPGALVASHLLRAPTWAAVVLVVATTGSAVVDLRATGVVLVGALPALAAVVIGAGRGLLAEYGFTVAESADGLRLRHGLLETRSATVPLDRVQVVRVREPLLWRPFGWVRVDVDVAGYAAGGDVQLATTALLPVAPKALGLALVARVLAAPLPAPVAAVPDRARWLAPLSHPRLLVGLDDRHLTARRGVVTTTTDVVPLAKLQSIRLRQGPLQRRLRLAGLHLDTAGRRIPGTVAPHRDADEAARLLDDVAARARRARTPG